MNNSFNYYDQRYGDTYTVFLDLEGNFEQALRYVDKVGFNAISYDELAELPPFHRHAIETEIGKLKSKMNKVL